MSNDQINVWGTTTLSEITNYPNGLPSPCPIQVGTTYSSMLVYNLSGFYLDIKDNSNTYIQSIQPWVITPVSFDTQGMLYLSINPTLGEQTINNASLQDNQQVFVVISSGVYTQNPIELNPSSTITGGQVNVTVPEPLEIINEPGTTLDVTGSLNIPNGVVVNTMPNVNIETMPNVNIETMPSVTIGTMPDVTIGAMPSVTIGTMPDVTIGAMPSVDIATMPNISGSVITVSGKTSIALTTNMVVKLSSGVIGSISNTGATTTGTVSVYDSPNSASGTIIWSGSLLVGQVQPINMPTSTGIYVVVPDGTNITLSYS